MFHHTRSGKGAGGRRVTTGTLTAVAAAAAGLCLLLPGAAAAGTAPARSKTIHACYKKSNGVLSVGRHCGHGRRSISWNRRGRTGPQGPAGTFGTVTTLSQSGKLSGYAQGAASIACPTGDVATGGGGSFGPGTGEGIGQVAIETSRPNPASGTPTGWYVILRNSTANAVTASIYVVCVSH